MIRSDHIRSYLISASLLLAGCAADPYTTEEVLQAEEECRDVGLSTGYVRHYYSGLIIGHQCMPAEALGAWRYPQ